MPEENAASGPKGNKSLDGNGIFPDEKPQNSPKASKVLDGILEIALKPKTKCQFRGAACGRGCLMGAFYCPARL